MTCYYCARPHSEKNPVTQRHVLALSGSWDDQKACEGMKRPPMCADCEKANPEAAVYDGIPRSQLRCDVCDGVGEHDCPTQTNPEAVADPPAFEARGVILSRWDHPSYNVLITGLGEADSHEGCTDTVDADMGWKAHTCGPRCPKRLGGSEGGLSTGKKKNPTPTSRPPAPAQEAETTPVVATPGLTGGSK